jgi:hypothetical protein
VGREGKGLGKRLGKRLETEEEKEEAGEGEDGEPTSQHRL